MTTTSSLLRALIEQAGDHAMFVIAPDGRNLTWNVGVERLLGYGEREFVGRHTREIFTPEDRAAGVPERELAFAAAQGQASDERWLLRKDGSRLWASGLTFRLRDGEGRLAGFGKVFRDLTIERQFDEELRRTTERYRIAARAAHEALWDRDLNTDTITWTDGFDHVLGCDPAGIGRDIAWWERQIHPDDRPAVVEGIGRAIRDGREDWEGEYRIRRCGGDYVLVQDRALIMRSADGVPLRMLGSLRDVTMERRSQALRRQALHLEGLGRLAGGVAHDLNNMLMAIIGFTDILERDLPEADERRRYTGEILASAGRSAGLTRRLLAFARREVTRPAVFDLNAVVVRLAPTLRSLLGEAVALELRLAPEPVQLEADQGQIEQVLVDLALNGRDAMPDGGRLTIETSERHLDEPTLRERHAGTDIPPGDYIILTVGDTGSGMSAEVLEHVFEPFYTTKDLGKGTGLGLAATYGAIKQNGGYIWASSELERGSAFEIYLPPARVTASS